jgi:hypothetical protein
MDLFSTSAIGLGYLFILLFDSRLGLTVQKSRLLDPFVIQSQLLLTDFTALQILLTALGTSQLLRSTYRPIESQGISASESRHAIKPHVLAPRYSSISGYLLLGVGIALGGSLPLTLYSQLAVSYYTSLLTQVRLTRC